MTASSATDGMLERRKVANPASQSSINDKAASEPMAAKCPGLRLASVLLCLSSLGWIGQAAMLAVGVGAISDGGGVGEVAVPAAVVAGIGVLRACLDAAGGRRAFVAARRELSAQRAAATAALAACSPLDSGRPASGLAASVLGEQAEAVVPYLARFRPIRMRASLVPLVMLLCILPISWLAALILTLCAPLIPIFMALIGWRAKAASERQLAETGGINAFLLDRLRGLATIRALDAVDLTAGRLRADADSLRLRTMAVLRIAFLSSAVLEFFAALGVAATAVYVGFSLLGSIEIGTWNGRLTLTQGFFILLLAPAFFEPLRELSAVWHDRANGEAALSALKELAPSRQTILGGAKLQSSTPTSQASVEIEALVFRHTPGRDAAIDHFDLSIGAGEHVALWGASGSGKTTLLSLIAGLARHEGGVIRIGGIPLRDDTADALRHRMAWIGQSPHIFAGSVMRNIALGRGGIDAPAVASALESAALDRVFTSERIAAVGEGGLGLSGGEALRLMLARMMVDERADIILADEPTAHLDARTAAAVTDTLLALAKSRILIVATHDPVLAARMDRIVRLDERARRVTA
ncbi:ATP-binding cassette subfamily C protein CydD [Rhizobium sp. ERR 922]|uniref:thiol reductant ABC exporter subunit CydD n=1 Tax=unclassified Rhizobium TaxID=2613769 RepID=UPI0011ABE979|nr:MULTISPECIES: thiol reductant ABC exporter subunit CydD [unclassified Rhizobium]TWB57540.1 ATP-binding cassette subfamily C protein CydD [Rhizobium sp. ERR 922]TWB99235.1 ATP-binding cassette subfamily C protein CydD [Rhizobium sp. ERR 942]